MAWAKCPKCEKGLLSIKMETIDLNVPGGGSYRGVVYSCPTCSAAIGAGPDFLIMRDDIVNGVVKKLRG